MSAKDRYLAAVGKDLQRKEGRRVTEVSEKHRAIARSVLRKGTPIVHALIAAGYSSRKPAKACMWCAEFMD